MFNGTLNGIRCNGICNGIQFNGTLNGIRCNGIFNGIRYNGIFNGIQCNGILNSISQMFPQRNRSYDLYRSRVNICV